MTAGAPARSRRIAAVQELEVRPTGGRSSWTSRRTCGMRSAKRTGPAALVYVPHTTAAVTINEHIDPKLLTDFEEGLEKMVDERVALAARRRRRPERPIASAGLADRPTGADPAAGRGARPRYLPGDLLLRVRRPADAESPRHDTPVVGAGHASYLRMSRRSFMSVKRMSLQRMSLPLDGPSR